MAKNVDPDQMPHSAVSDLGLYCKGLSVPIFRFFYGKTCAHCQKQGKIASAEGENPHPPLLNETPAYLVGTH